MSDVYAFYMIRTGPADFGKILKLGFLSVESVHVDFIRGLGVGGMLRFGGFCRKGEYRQ